MRRAAENPSGSSQRVRETNASPPHTAPFVRKMKSRYAPRDLLDRDRSHPRIILPALPRPILSLPRAYSPLIDGVGDTWFFFLPKKANSLRLLRTDFCIDLLMGEV